MALCNEHVIDFFGMVFFMSILTRPEGRMRSSTYTTTYPCVFSILEVG